MMAANSNGPERGAFKKKGEKGRKNTKFRTNRANNNNGGKTIQNAWYYTRC